MLIDFLLPAPCVICGKLPKPLCQQCWPSPINGRDSLAGEQLFFSAELEGECETLIKHYKDKSRLVLERPLGELLEYSILQAANESFDCYAIPPKNSINFRRRGFDPLQRIVRRTSLKNFPRLSVAPNRKLADQRKLSFLQRQQNLVGAFQVRPGKGRVLLVDDVVTTGATLRELKRACQQAGYEVAAFCVIARRFGITV
ncbi:MAG: hypothetical protein RLZZ579_684 [Actinomycetota bacterium]